MSSAAALAVAVLLVAGCSSNASEPTATPPPVGAPVLDQDFPDPDVLGVDGTYYAYATNGNHLNVQMAESHDFEHWSVLTHDALPQLPSWIVPGKTWAPEVTAIAPGSYVMYFTATNFQPSVQCIGAATSNSPTGPFTVQGTGMLVCPVEEGGAIDAATYVESGVPYLLWKNDGNSRGVDTWISIAPLTADGLSLAGPAQRILKQTLPWEGGLVEAPTLVKHSSTYYLFYSSNDYGSDKYAIGYATADSLGGPWTKKQKPFLSRDFDRGEFLGPGGQDVVHASDGTDWLVFHAWDPALTYRALHAERLRWKPSGPVLVPD
jgi:arabinan endo-1,5-alpha-L-arabinosidase